MACYVEASEWRGKRKVWIFVNDVPWLVRSMYDQFCLGGVPLLPEQCGDDSQTSAVAGGIDDSQTSAMAEGEGSAAAELEIS